ncbi:MAG TPA: hypothetical protein VH643_23620 [Gemmataceae bacterium]|jgi:hypothetical protein
MSDKTATDKPDKDMMQRRAGQLRRAGLVANGATCRKSAPTR